MATKAVFDWTSDVDADGDALAATLEACIESSSMDDDAAATYLEMLAETLVEYAAQKRAGLG